jgi:hypothetical protein
MFPTGLQANRVEFEGCRIARRLLLWPMIVSWVPSNRLREIGRAPFGQNRTKGAIVDSPKASICSAPHPAISRVPSRGPPSLGHGLLRSPSPRGLSNGEGFGGGAEG